MCKLFWTACCSCTDAAGHPLWRRGSPRPVHRLPGPTLRSSFLTERLSEASHDSGVVVRNTKTGRHECRCH
ncbi:MAG TPA: hypothetical protein VFU49_21570 [Ktedonobacteraceae bacterium]|nr:hypothetical protein [Ktedonobacteraceae bacterium]